MPADTSAAPPQTDAPTVQIDIVSDVMCPWCIVGYKQLEQALGAVGVGAYIRWHPFELNPQMPAEGQNMAEHLAEKYGSTPAQSAENRKRLTSMGRALGFTFNFTDDTRMQNTFLAHQLLTWAQSKGLQHPLKMALFDAHFTQGRNVGDKEVLTDIAASVGLDPAEAKEVLASGSYAAQTREAQQIWTSRGISGVPSMIFEGKYLITGAQGAENYAQLLRKVLEERDAAA
ncbi:DsbA family oxidoreductase [Sulfitobacter sp. S0837]|uniref:DsbA family oxidoreductase n=1 Tax=Sulfitobacter maritimus TaxID=2741719 RepID=UPI0015830254|nr:DsbA family oxidoreductase [Sulfitobacter maritimus]NUH64775.1 DsbA family oxidoreductase [Sulfitobacter maritimus]